MKPREEIKRELVRQWLSKADEDLGVAQHLLSQDTPYLTAIGFHSQQAAEKYLKAVLVHHQIEFFKTHNLGELLDLVGKGDAALADSLSDLTALTPYSVDVRYPGDLPELSPEDARAALNLAAKARDLTRKSLERHT